ncbi:glycosyltransferase 87 family protein [Ktedonosporobacter rubrisoli]|uniref:glycosyltransferase 87 family protein n=1 Tax=Ktedonosporobacter rubrisoli TaxID=2509675 RepID=UPI0013EE8A04|nr:glycosyltransferase 87 family protein [Ktedonosporobacter rubrisoli]
MQLLPLPLGLSRDAWRYLWDAHILLHGYSPYLYAPNNPIFAPLHGSIYTNTPYREFPTKYPPGAELFYILGYLLSPKNLVGLKGLFVLCDLLTCVALAILLACRGLDPRQVIVYAWCPLPIVEFSIQGHVDALVIACTVIAVFCSRGSSRTARITSGVFLGLAILAKLYPALLLLVLVRRRDWNLPAACALTVVLGYLPFLWLSHGQIAAVVLSFSGQDTLHPSFIQNGLLLLGHSMQLAPTTMLVVGRVIEGAIGVSTVLFVKRQFSRKHISIEGAVLVLIGIGSCLYSYVFPWYIPALLPWIAVLIAPLRRISQGFSIKKLAIVVVCLSTYAVILTYLPDLR